MRTYLVDTENISSAWLPMLSMLGKGDKLILFYTEFSCVLPYSALDAILTKPKQVKTVECERSGKNSLDFQLVSYLGYLLHKNDKNEYVIISNDKGFWSVAAFWSKKDCHVECWTVDQLQQYITMRTIPNASMYEPEDAKETPVTTEETASTPEEIVEFPKLVKTEEPTKSDEITKQLFTQLNEIPSKFHSDNKFVSLSLGTKMNIAKYTYKLMKVKCENLNSIILAKTIAIMCFNRDINQISNILSAYGMPIKQLMPAIKQCIGSVRRKIKSCKKQKKTTVYQQVLHQSALVLKRNGISPPDAEMFAGIIANSTKLSSLITQIKQKTNAKTSKLIISVLPECYAA